MSLFQMSLAGAGIILITVVMRALALYRLPKRAFLAMWSIAALRLLIPYRLPSRLSVFGLFARPVQIASGETVGAAQGLSANAVQAVGAPLTSAAVSPMQWIWLAGMTLLALGFCLLYGYGRRRFRENDAVDDPRVAVWLCAHPLRRTVSVRSSGALSAPLTYGLLRPVILLPREMNASDEALDLILSHEWVHVRRMDGLRKLALVAAVCVHWFNPLVWIMLVLANRDLELTCDEQVLRMRGDRRAYARTLIHMESETALSAPLCSYFAKNAIEERIIAIMKTKRITWLSAALALLMVLGSAVVFATTASAVTYGRDAGENPAEFFAQYEPFGLTYDAEGDCLYYQGEKVRCFEDMYPIGEEGAYSGTFVTQESGVVDVHAVRDLSGDIVRNEDGSFDASGVLIGVEADSQEEFDARTRWMEDSLKGEIAGTACYENTANGDVLLTGGVAEDAECTASSYSMAYVVGDEGDETEIYTMESASTYPSEAPEGAEQADNGVLSAEMFAEYASFGLTVEDNALYFEGQRVRQFTDTYTAGFFRTVSCEHYDEAGEIDVKAVRDGSSLVGLKIIG